jgi:hypothetical protein
MSRSSQSIVVEEIVGETLSLLTRLLAVVVFLPLFFFPGALVGLIGAWCGHIYMASQLSVKRELSNAKSPVLGQYVQKFILVNSQC